jgi:hypothetical protein
MRTVTLKVKPLRCHHRTLLGAHSRYADKIRLGILRKHQHALLLGFDDPIPCKNPCIRPPRKSITRAVLQGSRGRSSADQELLLHQKAYMRFGSVIERDRGFRNQQKIHWHFEEREFPNLVPTYQESVVCAYGVTTTGANFTIMVHCLIQDGSQHTEMYLQVTGASPTRPPHVMGDLLLQFILWRITLASFPILIRAYEKQTRNNHWSERNMFARLSCHARNGGFKHEQDEVSEAVTERFNTG